MLEGDNERQGERIKQYKRRMSKIQGVGVWVGYGGWWGGRCARLRLPRGVMSPNLPAVFYDKGLRVKGLFCRCANLPLSSCVLLLNVSAFHCGGFTIAYQ